MRLLVAAALVSFALAPAAQPIAWPAMGQSARQQEQDTSQCQAWARQAGGADTASAGASHERDAAGAQVQDALAGARAGGVAGGISDASGEAAAAGAALGPRAGRPAPAAAEASMRDQAFAACMSRRGYTFK
jgi:hypothetical protein